MLGAVCLRLRTALDVRCLTCRSQRRCFRRESVSSVESMLRRVVRGEKPRGLFRVRGRQLSGLAHDAASCARSSSCICMVSSERRETGFGFKPIRWNISSLNSLLSSNSSSLSSASLILSHSESSSSSSVPSCFKDLTKALLPDTLASVIWSTLACWGHD